MEVQAMDLELGISLAECIEQAYEIAKKKGWFDKDIRPLEQHALIVREVSEATENVRGNVNCFYMDAQGKPQGEAVELADAVLRIMSYASHQGWDLERILLAKMKYNKTRPYRHGGKVL
jgi:NTP pyrophosphatase (non-canonical NTP hydrolase)